jgi:hypothetical protein
MRLWKKIAQSVSRTIFFVKINAQPKPRKKVAQKCEAVYANFQKKKKLPKQTLTPVAKILQI